MIKKAGLLTWLRDPIINGAKKSESTSKINLKSNPKTCSDIAGLDDFEKQTPEANEYIYNLKTKFDGKNVNFVVKETKDENGNTILKGISEDGKTEYKQVIFPDGKQNTSLAQKQPDGTSKVISRGDTFMSLFGENTYETYGLVDSNNKVIELEGKSFDKKGQLLGKSTITQDEYGQRNINEQFDENGKLILKNVNYIDESGNKVYENHNAEGLQSKIVNYNDENGRDIVENYDGNGKLLYRQLNYTDENNNEVSEIYNNGEIVNYTTSNIDENGVRTTYTENLSGTYQTKIFPSASPDEEPIIINRQGEIDENGNFVPYEDNSSQIKD